MIDYTKLADSQRYYTGLGYKYIDVPWKVSEEINQSTCPSDKEPVRVLNKTLIASGEQGFLHLMSMGLLSPGKYQTITPCFRQDSCGLFHKEEFMKNELIITDNISNESLQDMIKEAASLFKTYINKPLTIVRTSEMSYDIEINNIELGSYGIRSIGPFSYIYGTGLAEPRLSRALRCLKE